MSNHDFIYILIGLVYIIIGILFIINFDNNKDYKVLKVKQIKKDNDSSKSLTLDDIEQKDVYSVESKVGYCLYLLLGVLYFVLPFFHREGRNQHKKKE